MAANIGTEWSQEQYDRMRELWAQGLTAARIAEMLGRSRNSIISCSRRLKLPSRPSPIGQTARAQAVTRGRNPADTDTARNIKRRYGMRRRAEEDESLARKREREADAARIRAEMEAARVQAIAGERAAREAARQATECVMVDRRASPTTSCCWPLWGDRERPTHRYCEAPLIALSAPYCMEHTARASNGCPQGEPAMARLGRMFGS